ncbi:M20 family metallopeptidase [Pseudomonas avellanae]|nr:M20 family metallopeptidase [Pseudomonas avellanae]MDU8428257.1 M20 family metallopeptidase [Pseudomonas syringae pv. actinidifoliorum]EKG33957.1 peptidase, M20/M25/M40 family [Pseudomonas avellanae BPIC 631]MDU8519601.1 M20 family metallopeptidase [Pseudomonas syringae pv. actinidifoliorum]MDU8525650.1 M20 family metallopeptidase [Pseudomonas syringae pv. actinidifoliorum]UQW71590.1 M20 family metallopeptidase [Pseudomonas avellanae]
MKKCIALIFTLFVCKGAWAGTARDEQSITSYIDSHGTEQIALLEKLVNINSGTDNVEGVVKVGNLIKPELEALGFETTWHDLPSAMNHAGSLVAVHDGNKSAKRVLLIGHLDTVFPQTSSFQTFAYLDGGKKAKGPGVIDDKGGVVTMLYALQALKHSGALEKMNISVVLIGDEELAAKPTEISREWLIAEAKRSDIALGFEFALSPNQLITERRGLSEWFLTSTGIDKHSATIFQPETGFGAMYESARVLDEIRQKLSNEQGLTINPGLILGGSTAAEDSASGQGTASGRKTTVARITSVHGDLRFSSEDQRASAETRMKEIASHPLPQTNSDLKIKAIMPVMADRESNRQLLAAYSQVSQDLDGPALESAPSAERGGADISYVNKYVTASLDGLGAWGTGAHSENETIELGSLPVVTKRAAIFLIRYGNN